LSRFLGVGHAFGAIQSRFRAKVLIKSDLPAQGVVASARRAVPVDDNMAAVIKKVGVIGAGQMGNGIAHVAALAGFDVVLNDISADRLKSGMATINGNLARQVSKKAVSEDDKAKAMARITPAEKLDDLADCDLVIETAVEKEEVKRKIFHELCAVLKPEAIVASDTSSISITRLAAATDRPERFIGIHFMNPVPLMELVELIRGIATDPRHRHRRCDLRGVQGIRRQARQAGRGLRGFPGLHRQPHPVADDQRGDLHAV
jgi:hypothetical protein